MNSRLDLKVPPPAVAALCALLMWTATRQFPGLEFENPVRSFASGSLAMAGLFFDIAGFLAFQDRQTTINPFNPAGTTVLVQHGIYRFTRNPMYVGQLLLLSSWAVWLSHFAALIGLPVFVAYLTRFQIIPEERILAAKFGEAYSNYAKRARRWC